MEANLQKLEKNKGDTIKFEPPRGEPDSMWIL